MELDNSHLKNEVRLMYSGVLFCCTAKHYWPKELIAVGSLAHLSGGSDSRQMKSTNCRIRDSLSHLNDAGIRGVSTDAVIAPL
jgi:hypothetical protein